MLDDAGLQYKGRRENLKGFLVAKKQQSGGYNPNLLPNTCQTPNVILDQWMFSLTGAEFKIVMYAVRRTYGFGRNSSRISKSEFVHGTKDKDGNLLDHGTGLGKSTVKDAIHSLVDKGILKERLGLAQSGANATNRYSLNLKYLPEAPEEHTSEEQSEGGQKLTPQGPENGRGEGPKTDPSGGQKMTPSNTHGNPGGNPVDLPSVDPSSHAARTRESNPATEVTGPTDRPLDLPTREEHQPPDEPRAMLEEQPSDGYAAPHLFRAEDGATTTKAAAPNEPEAASRSFFPEEDADNAAPPAVDALRQQAEAIPTNEVEEEARWVGMEVLERLPVLSKRDQCRVMRLAEHYRRNRNTTVLRDAADRVSKESKQTEIRSVWRYLTKSCAEAESDYSEGDEDLLASLSGENTGSSSEESNSTGYEWFYDSESPENAESGGENRQHTPEPDPDALVVWEKVLDEVTDEINAPSLRVWFEGTVPVALSNDQLVVSVPNQFAREYIESRFVEVLERALAKHLSPASSLEIVVGVEDSTNNTDEKGDSKEQS